MYIFLYAVLLTAAVIISFIISYHSWKRRPAKGSEPLALLMFSLAVWILGQMLTDLSTAFDLKLFFEKAKFLGITIVPFSWLLLALQYTRNERFTTRNYIFLLLIIPVISNITIWTGGNSSLFLTDFKLVHNGFIDTFSPTKQIWFWVHTYSSYVYIALGNLLMVGYNEGYYYSCSKKYSI